MRRQAGVIWIVGRPASGKTSLARRIVRLHEERKRRATLIDSDEVQQALAPEPDFSLRERELLYRAMAWTAERLSRNGVTAVVAATSHRREQRQWVREICGRLVFVLARCSIGTCRARDPKGLYRAADMDPNNRLPGLGEPWEEPAGARPIDTEEPIGDTELADFLRKIGH